MEERVHLGLFPRYLVVWLYSFFSSSGARGRRRIALVGRVAKKKRGRPQKLPPFLH